MRKYQAKKVAEVRELYQTNDPLRWVYISLKLGSNRPMTAREQHIFKRRMFKSIKKLGVAAADAIKNMTRVFSSFGASMAKMAQALQLDRMTPPGAIGIGHVPPRRSIVSDRLYAASVKVPDTPVIHGLGADMIILDEAVSLSDDDIDKLTNKGGTNEKTNKIHSDNNE